MRYIYRIRDYVKRCSKIYDSCDLLGQIHQSANLFTSLGDDDGDDDDNDFTVRIGET